MILATKISSDRKGIVLIKELLRQFFFFYYAVRKKSVKMLYHKNNLRGCRGGLDG